MAQKSKKHGKSVLLGRGTKGTNVGMPVHILTKEDIKKEIAEGEKRFGMPVGDFYKAWQDGKFHGFQAMKLGCLYELYKDEYE